MLILASECSKVSHGNCLTGPLHRNLHSRQTRAVSPIRYLSYANRRCDEETDSPEETLVPAGLPQVRGTEPSAGGQVQEVQVLGPAIEEPLGGAQEVNANTPSLNAEVGPVV